MVPRPTLSQCTPNYFTSNIPTFRESPGLGTPEISGVGHSRESLALDSKESRGWALQGVSGVCRESLGLGTPGSF